MKRVTVLFNLLVFCVVMSFAQFSLTYKTHGLLANEDNINEMKLTKYLDPGNGGSNQVWDFTKLEITDNFKGTIESSLTDKNYNDLLQTNVALKEFENQFYFKGDNNSLELYGIAVNDKLIMKFNTPFVKMKYPFTYGNSFSGIYNGEYYSGNLTGTVDGTYSVQCDGYGTLLLPNNLTVKNTIRVKTDRTYKTSFSQGNSFDVEIISYRWYVKDIRFPVLVLIQEKVMSGTSTSFDYKAAYRSNLFEPTDIQPNYAETNDNTMFVFPNPTNDILNINFILVNEGKINLEVYNTSGKMFRSLVDSDYPSGQSSYQISFKQLDLPGGTYYLRLIQDNKVLSIKKIIVQ